MFEDDDFMDEDRSVLQTKWGAAVVPNSMKNMRGDALETYVDLQQLARQLAELEAVIWTEAIPAARQIGLSWSVIGAAVGMTGMGVAKRIERESQE